MCGITGIIGLSPSLSKERLHLMTDRLSHRGPDSAGYWIDGYVALGHRRLSVIDVDERANQPMQDLSIRYTMVYNGELYNFKELKNLLPNYSFKTQSDSEVILAAYAEWGKECLSYFNGMFAFAIWDAVKEELFIARDRMGIKPLYYYLDNNVFVFASEVRALLESGLVPRTLCPIGLVDFLKYQTVHSPNTILKDVHQLEPGTFGITRNGKIHTETYWKLEDKTSQNTSEYKVIKEQCSELLCQAVERRMIADVPLGAFLSGGIDSSAVVALMAECSERPIHTFTIGFSEKKYDESRYAKMISKKYKTKHTLLKLSPSAFLNQIPHILSSMDVPSGDGPNTYVVSKMTKEAGMTVALSGLGGDELFGGYSTFTRFLSIHKNKWLWKFPRNMRNIIGNGFNICRGQKIGKSVELIKAPSSKHKDILPIFRRLMSDATIGKLTQSLPLEYNYLNSLLADREQDLNLMSLMSQVSFSEIKGYTQNVLLRDSDQMSMASALELRVPFFDHKLVEYVMQIPDKFKYPTFPKKLLVEALSPRLPDDIVYRKKMGFTLPWEYWLKNELKSFCVAELEQLGKRKYFKAEALQEYWLRFLNGDKRVGWSKIWNLVVLENWMNRNGIN